MAYNFGFKKPITQEELFDLESRIGLLEASLNPTFYFNSTSQTLGVIGSPYDFDTIGVRKSENILVTDNWINFLQGGTYEISFNAGNTGHLMQLRLVSGNLSLLANTLNFIGSARILFIVASGTRLELLNQSTNMVINSVAITKVI